MDINQINPEQLAQLRSLINIMQHMLLNGNQSSSDAGHRVNPPPSTHAPPGEIVSRSTLPSGPFWDTSAHTQSSQPRPFPSAVADVPVALYQSARPTSAPASQGPLSNSALINSGGPSSQAFLGLESLSLNTRSHVNQHRLASSAAHSTGIRPARRTRRRRAAQPPSLPRSSTAKIDDCLEIVADVNGIASELWRVKIKVYPPQLPGVNDIYSLYSKHRLIFRHRQYYRSYIFTVSYGDHSAPYWKLIA